VTSDLSIDPMLLAHKDGEELFTLWCSG